MTPTYRSVANQHGRAVVIGAGIGGLLAARVLAEAFQSVTVIDRDGAPSPHEARPGSPQGRHAHALLTRGVTAIERLFPGMTQEFSDDGIPAGDLLANTDAYFDRQPYPDATCGLTGFGISRFNLEYRLRRRVEALANVHFATQHAVVGLTVDADAQVTGVHLSASEHADVSSTLEAELVVDCTGRRSQAARWLAGLGYDTPDEKRHVVNLAYSSCRISLPATAMQGKFSVAVGPTTDCPRGGTIIRVEGNQFIVSLTGYAGDHPPVTQDGLIKFARSLPVPVIAELLQDATWLTKPVRYRFNYAYRRHFERLSRFPDGFLIMGDAACSFNPVYGQGMSVAAMEAEILRDCLGQGLHGLRRFHTEAARAVDSAWIMSVNSDLRVLPTVIGSRTLLVRLSNIYTARLGLAGAVDPIVATAFLRVLNLLDPPSNLVRPGILARVMVATMRLTIARRRSRTNNASEEPSTIAVRGEVAPSARPSPSQKAGSQ